MNKFFSELGEWVECFLGGFALVMLAMSLLCLDGCSLVEDNSTGSALPSGWCDSHRCSREPLFTVVDEDLRSTLESSIARYRVATGRIDISDESQDGIPVMWTDEKLVWDGVEDCAQTMGEGMPGEVFAQSIKIARNPPRGCPDVSETLLHEVIHALAPNVDHAAYGMFARASQGSKIDEPAMEQLCSEFDCLSFSPESE